MTTQNRHKAARIAARRERFATRAAQAAHPQLRDSVERIADYFALHGTTPKRATIEPRRNRASAVRIISTEG